MSAGTPEGRQALGGLERTLLAVCLVGWGLASAAASGVLRVGSLLPLGLYPLYGFAGALGWGAGIVYSLRRRAYAAAGLRRRLLLLLLCGPPAWIFLLHEMDSVGLQIVAPLAPVWGLGGYLVFFAVPVGMRPRLRRD